MMRYPLDKTLHFLNQSSSIQGAKKRKQRSLHRCFRHFWDRMMKSKRKTYIIDKDIPFGQQLYSWWLNVQLVTCTTNLTTTFSDISNKACNYSCSLSAPKQNKYLVWLYPEWNFLERFLFFSQHRWDPYKFQN